MTELNRVRVASLLVVSFLAKIVVDHFAYAVSPIFGVYGVLVEGEYFSFHYLYSWVLYCLVLILPIFYMIPRRDVLDYSIFFVFYSFVIPLLACSWILPEVDYGFLHFSLVFWFLLYFLLVFLGSRGCEVGVLCARSGLSIRLFSRMYIACLFFLASVMYLRFGIPADFGFDSVYERRKSFVEWRGGGLWVYLFNWSVYVFATYLVFISHSRMAKILGITYLLFFFGVAGDKVYLFLFLSIFFLVTVVRMQSVLLVPLLFVSLGGVGVGSYYYSESPWLPAIVNRFLLLPMDISYHYTAFFKGEYLVYSYSFLSAFFAYPYSQLPASLIGDHFYNAGDNANVNFLADAYINIGWFSLPVLLVFFASLRRCFSNARFLILLVPFLTQLLNAPLPTSILTGGGWLAIFTCALLNMRWQQGSIKL